jgi:8-oxo-dGTP pyrophosphatase MutT (NUDIX family)
MKEIFNRLSDRRAKILDEEDYFSSAVVLPIIKNEQGEQILFEVRSANLNRQPGEVCFPGGKVEKDEISNPLHTAYRETCEELGVTKNQIELIGELDVMITPYGAIIHPYVCLLKAGTFNPNPAEVERIFTVPLSFFLHSPPKLHKVDIGTRYGPTFDFSKVPDSYKQGWQKRWAMPVYAYEFENYYIWGFTARIIYNFIKLCWPENTAYSDLF